MAQRRTLRDELVRRGLVKAAEVEAVLSANRVRVNGAVVANPSSLVAAGDSVSVAGEPSRYVSRGGQKLEGALVDFGLDVTDWSCLDAGSSTGGFSDCLLQHGAKRVIAVDVGRGQLHHRLAIDPRVTSWESRNILDVTGKDLAKEEGFAAGADLVVADLSFTSSARLAGHLVDLVRLGGHIVVMVKPQFEADRADVPLGGVVRDPQVQARAVESVETALRAAGCDLHGVAQSTISGADGNLEFFVWGSRSSDRSQ